MVSTFRLGTVAAGPHAVPGKAAYLTHETAASIWTCSCCRRPWAPSRSSCPTSTAAAGEAASTYHCTSRALQAPCGGLPDLCSGAVLVAPLACRTAGGTELSSLSPPGQHTGPDTGQHSDVGAGWRAGGMTPCGNASVKDGPAGGLRHLVQGNYRICTCSILLPARTTLFLGLNTAASSECPVASAAPHRPSTALLLSSLRPAQVHTAWGP